MTGAPRMAAATPVPWRDQLAPRFDEARMSALSRAGAAFNICIRRRGKGARSGDASEFNKGQACPLRGMPPTSLFSDDCFAIFASSRPVPLRCIYSGTFLACLVLPGATRYFLRTSDDQDLPNQRVPRFRGWLLQRPSKKEKPLTLNYVHKLGSQKHLSRRKSITQPGTPCVRRRTAQ